MVFDMWFICLSWNAEWNDTRFNKSRRFGYRKWRVSVEMVTDIDRSVTWGGNIPNIYSLALPIIDGEFSSSRTPYGRFWYYSELTAWKTLQVSQVYDDISDIGVYWYLVLISSLFFQQSCSVFIFYC